MKVNDAQLVYWELEWTPGQERVEISRNNCAKSSYFDGNVFMVLHDHIPDFVKMDARELYKEKVTYSGAEADHMVIQDLKAKLEDALENPKFKGRDHWMATCSSLHGQIGRLESRLKCVREELNVSNELRKNASMEGLKEKNAAHELVFERITKENLELSEKLECAQGDLKVSKEMRERLREEVAAQNRVILKLGARDD